MKERILILVNASLLCFLGLWDLFSENLPDLNSTGLIAIFPRVYHIVVSSQLFFLYPLLNKRNNFWFLLGFSMSIMVTISAAAQIFTETSRMLSLTVILGLNLILNGLAIYFLTIKRSK